MAKKKYRRYSPEFKRHALKRASEDGVTDKGPARILASVNVNYAVGEISTDFWVMKHFLGRARAEIRR